MGLPTLDEFLTQKKWRNSYVREPGFRALYVRLSTRYLNGSLYKEVLDIANIEARYYGTGMFTRLAERLLANGHILYVESVVNERFEKKLLRMGFTPIDTEPTCFFKLPKEESHAQDQA